MKNLMIALFITLFLGYAASAQTKSKSNQATTTKLVVLVNTASWCPACQANGKRVEQEVISSYMKNSKCQVVVNNLSDDKSKAISKKECESAGITKIAEGHTATGMIYLVNSQTKEIIGQISVIKTSDEIKTTIENALSTL